jgi:PAS domain S-box-containing protein
MILQIFDNDPLFAGFVDILLVIAFSIGICITLIIFLRKRTSSNLIQVIIMIIGVIFSLCEVFGLSKYLGRISFFAISIIFVFFIIKKSKQKLQRLNRELEQKVEERTGELKESEEKYRTLVNNVIDIIFETNLDGKFTYISPQVKVIFGYQPEEMIDYKIYDFIHQEDLMNVKKAFRNDTDTGLNVYIECRMSIIDGNYILVSVRGSLVKKDNIVKIVGVIRDITEQKKAENMIREQIEKLKEIDQIKSDLIRRASHELKTPLIGVLSSSQYLLESCNEEMSESVIKFVKIINRGGDRLKKLTNNLVDAFDIESKGLVLKKEKVDIVKIIKDCANDLIFSLKERHLLLKNDLIGSYYIEVDEIRIEQVILNLLSNAIKNTPPNGIIYINLEKDENFVDIIIRDTGVGFTEDEKELIFKKFGKIERTFLGKDVNIEGSGLGLFISKEIVDLHGGKIILESEGRNKGSSFVIKLPI